MNIRDIKREIEDMEDRLEDMACEFMSDERDNLEYALDGAYRRIAYAVLEDEEIMDAVQKILDKKRVEAIKKEILEVLDDQDDGFITANQDDFANYITHDFYTALDELIKEGILKRRNCAGEAYERVI